VRTTIKDRIEDQYVQASPGGRMCCICSMIITGRGPEYRRPRQHHQGDRDLVCRQAVRRTVKQKPAFGVAGWATDDSAVWLYDKLDIWSVTPDGKAKRLTDGAAEQVRYRYLRLDPEADFVDREASFRFRHLVEESGFARLDANAAAPKLERAVWLDKSVTGLSKAKSAEIYAYVVQAFDDSPDYFVGARAGEREADQPHQSLPIEFCVGPRRADRIQERSGERLQGSCRIRRL
jgi:hypothetical protein